MTGDAKRELRRAGRERRAGRSREDCERAGDAIAGHAESVAGDTVALYAGIEAEPPTLRLVDRLLRRGTRIFLPILRSDMDLEWAPVESVDELITSSYGLLEPTRPSLGTRGICEVDLILAPGLAVDVSGVRLGQGGGCYDRALTRVSAPVYVVVFDDEIVDWLPSESHDRRVDGTLTPSGGIARLRGAPPGAAASGYDPTPDTTQ